MQGMGRVAGVEDEGARTVAAGSGVRDGKGAAATGRWGGRRREEPAQG